MERLKQMERHHTTYYKCFKDKPELFLKAGDILYNGINSLFLCSNSRHTAAEIITGRNMKDGNSANTEIWNYETKVYSDFLETIDINNCDSHTKNILKNHTPKYYKPLWP